MKSALPKTGTSLNWLKAHVESASKSLVVSVFTFCWGGTCFFSIFEWSYNPHLYTRLDALFKRLAELELEGRNSEIPLTNILPIA